MILKEVRKEDDLYYQGAFWLIGNSVKDIKTGNSFILGNKLSCDFNGKYLVAIESKNALSHKRIWTEFSADYNNVPYNYYPRGRVSIYNGTAYIHIHHLFNQPDIIDKIISEYNLKKLEIEVETNDITQGFHYDFLLK